MKLSMLLLQHVSDPELLSQTQALAREERHVLSQVLEHLREIERRALYLQAGCPSLFEFCQRQLGYSKDEAYVRVSAMRLAREVPEVLSAVREGKIPLTNLVKAQSYFRKEKKAGRPVPKEAKQALLTELQGLSTQECERRLSPQALSKRVFLIDEALEGDLERIRALWGNQDLSDTEMLRQMAKLVLSRIDPLKRAEELEKRKAARHERVHREAQGQAQVRAQAQAQTHAQAKSSVGAKRVKPEAAKPRVNPSSWEPFPDPRPLPEPPPELVTPETRSIPESVKSAVWQRDQGRCTHQGAHTQRCPSKYALQLDHLTPYAHGGAHTPSNLRLLCRAHHQARET